MQQKNSYAVFLNFSQTKISNTQGQNSPEQSISPGSSSSNFEDLQNDPATLNQLINDIDVQFADASSMVESLRSSELTSSQNDNLALLQRELALLKNSTGKLTAPIRLPSEKDLEVKLVTVDRLDRLNEYYANESILVSLIGLTAGGGIAIVVNLVTGGIATQYFNAVTGILFASFVCFSVLAVINRRRMNDLKNELLS